MNVREIATSRLREYENNPRNNDLAVEKVKYSIERFGFLFPVVVDMNYVIVCGHTRVRACRELGISSVPCIIADELTEEQINLFRLIDNKTSEYSDWDFEKLKKELSQVDLTLERNQLLLDRFELSAEVFDLAPEQAEIKIPPFNFMVANEPAKGKKPPVRTIYSGGDTVEPTAEAEPIPSEPEPTVEAERSEDNAPPIGNVGEAPPKAEPIPSEPARAETAPPLNTESGEAKVEEPKKPKGVMPFCQFRFGDVAFFISQVELDRLNAKYAEYIDSGVILEGSFVNYLLKGVETHD